MQAQGGLTIERMCQLGPVSRAGFYRHWQRHEPVAGDCIQRSAIAPRNSSRTACGRDRASCPQRR